MKVMTPEEITPEVEKRLNNVKKRILFIPPSVAALEENEAKKEDFESLSNANIGVGGFGRVYKVRHKVSKNVYAIKVVNKQKILENELITQMKLEIMIMYKLDHEHIIKLYNHFEDDDNFYLIMQFASKGQLYTKLKMLGRLDERSAAQYMREVVSAVEYLHSLDPPIIHRDIKPENILLDAVESSKLADFGWSNFNKGNERVTYCGTPEYLAPEMIKQQGHNETIDLWNLGVLMFEFLTGKPPFEGNTQNELFKNIENIKINYPKGFSTLAKDLVSKLLKVDPKQRIPLNEIKKHPWFKAFPPKAGKVSALNKPIKAVPQANGTTEEGKSKENPHYEIISRRSIENHNEAKNIANSKLASKIEGIGDRFRNESKDKDAKDKIIDDLSKNIKTLTTELNNIKVELQGKNRELERMRTESLELPGSLGQSFEDNSKNAKLNEEVQRLKTVSKDREQLLETIEVLNTRIRDQETKIKLNSQQFDLLNSSKDMLQQKYSDLQERLIMSERKLMDMKNQYEETTSQKEQIQVELESKIEVLQYKLFNVNDTDDASENKFDHLLEVSNSIMQEIRDKVKQQIALNKNEENIRNELLEAYTKLNELRNRYENQIYDLNTEHTKKLDEVLEQAETEKNRLLKTKDEKIEELRAYIQQLEKKDVSSKIDQEEFAAIDRQNKMKQSLINDKGVEIGLLAQELTIQKGKSKELTQRIEELEYQLAVEKDKNLKKEMGGPMMSMQKAATSGWQI